jgi:RNA polymerase-binding transcription factor DksA
MQPHDSYRTALESELDTLRSELSTVAEQDPRTGDWVAVPPSAVPENADDNTQADLSEAWNERRAVLAQLEVRFHHVELALQKIVSGTYGACELCGEPIEPARLHANPASRTCQIHMERARELPL